MTLDEDDDVVIIYNRVPKTASTSFTNIAYDLCARNKYHVLHINTTKNNPVMSLQDQVGYVCAHLSPQYSPGPCAVRGQDNKMRPGPSPRKIMPPPVVSRGFLRPVDSLKTSLLVFI